jgi:hypothetical protein
MSAETIINHPAKAGGARVRLLREETKFTRALGQMSSTTGQCLREITNCRPSLVSGAAFAPELNELVQRFYAAFTVIEEAKIEMLRIAAIASYRAALAERSIDPNAAPQGGKQ